MPELPLRIISDLHYGERSSALRNPVQLGPLLGGARELWCNGDTLDTRPGPRPENYLRLRAELDAFVRRSPTPIHFLTGNHDPDISAQHCLDLAAGAVFVTHGDILFDEIVPWGRDAALARNLVHQARSESAGNDLAARLAAHRRAAAAIPQRHQAETHGGKHFLGLLADTLWPPARLYRILRAWWQLPHRAEILLQAHRPRARCIIVGHTHHAGIWRRASGRVVINTGAFCPPARRLAVDIQAGELIVRRIVHHHAAFHPGPMLARIPLPDCSETP